MITIGITGGSGMVGKHLVPMLVDKGYNVIIFTRSSNKRVTMNKQYIHWNPSKKKCNIEALQQIDAVINLAGAGVADKRWTNKRKKEILDSRIESTRFLIEMIREHATNCKTFIGASAIGYYGPDNGSIAFKEDMPAYTDFLGKVCQKWEDAEMQASDILRTIIFRIGIVLNKHRGAYAKLTRSMKYGIMPILGKGNQVLSWIHIEDLCRMMVYAIEHESLKGVYNAVAPNPVSNKELMRTVAAEKKGIYIPAYAPVFVLKMIFGEMSTEILKSTTVSSSKIEAAGFNFRFKTIEKAVKQLEH